MKVELFPRGSRGTRVPYPTVDRTRERRIAHRCLAANPLTQPDSDGIARVRLVQECVHWQDKIRAMEASLASAREENSLLRDKLTRTEDRLMECVEGEVRSVTVAIPG